MNPLKIGAVSYLNTKPLVDGLAESGEFELHYDLPSRLADRLAVDELDVALIPVIEAIANPLYTIVSDACIACRGPVWSVKLFSRRPLEQIRTLALDEGSRTSATLSKIILAKKYGVFPVTEKLPIEQRWQETAADAVLVIGDRAMNRGGDEFVVELDLGQFWNDWVQLPFVFAVWAARPGADLNLLDDTLGAARDRGLQNVAEICQASAASYGLTIKECDAYLSRHLHFQLGHQEKRGLSLYFEYARQLSLIDKNLELQFYDCKVTR